MKTSFYQIYLFTINLYNMEMMFEEESIYLTFQSLAAKLHNTRFNIQKFYRVLILHLCILCRSQDKQQLLFYRTLTDCFS